MRLMILAAVAVLSLGTVACSDSGSDTDSFGNQDPFQGANNPDTSFPDIEQGEPDTDIEESKPDTDEPDVEEEPDTPEETDTPEEPDGEAQEPGVLIFGLEEGDDGEECDEATECSVELNFGGDRQLFVRYEIEGEPVEGALIRFSLIGDDAQETLSAIPNAAFTDINGEAVTKIAVEENNSGTYQLDVTVDDDDEVETISWIIEVVSKAGPALTVRFAPQYEGEVAFDEIETTIYKKELEGAYACDTIELLGKLPNGGIGLPIVTSINGEVVLSTLPDLDEEFNQEYTIVALGKTTNGAVRIAGCNDEDGAVEWGDSTTVIVDMYAQPPDYTGCYNVTTKLDLTSALPSEVKEILDILFGLFESPTGGLALLACQFGDSVSVLEDLCGYVFANPEDPVIGEWDSTYANIIIEVVDGLILDLIDDEPLAADIFYTGQDITDILTALELRSVIEMKPLPGSGATIAIPDENGFFNSAQCEQTWNTVAFQWTLDSGCPPGDPDCGWIELNFNQFTNATLAKSSFSAEVSPTWYDMNVNNHSINFKYGALLNTIIKTYILPAIFGDGSDGSPKIDEYDEVILSLMCGVDGVTDQAACCETFAVSIAGAGGGFISDTIELACNAVVPLGSAFIEDQLVDLDLNDENMTLETMESCKLIDADENGVIDNWGSSGSPCKWDLTLDLFGTTVEFDAEFWAVRTVCE